MSVDKKTMLAYAVLSEINCGVCKEIMAEARGVDGKPEFKGGTDICICPKCKLEFSHKRGVPCNRVTCPECNIALTGKGASKRKR